MKPLVWKQDETHLPPQQESHLNKDNWYSDMIKTIGLRLTDTSKDEMNLSHTWTCTVGLSIKNTYCIGKNKVHHKGDAVSVHVISDSNNPYNRCKGL